MIRFANDAKHHPYICEGGPGEENSAKANDHGSHPECAPGTFGELGGRYLRDEGGLKDAKIGNGPEQKWSAQAEGLPPPKIAIFRGLIGMQTAPVISHQGAGSDEDEGRQEHKRF